MTKVFFNPAIKKFLHYVKPYRRVIMIATVCGLLKYNIPLIFPWIFKDVIDHLLSPSSYDASKLHTTMLAMIGLYFVWAVVTYFGSYYADQAGQRLVFDLRSELYVHLQRMSLSFYEKRQVGSIASRLLGDIAVAQNFVGAAFTNTVMDASSLLLIAFLLFRMNWRLALVSISIFPFYVMLNKYFKSQIKHTSKLARQKMEEISGNVHEKLGGISVIQSCESLGVKLAEYIKATPVYVSAADPGACALESLLESIHAHLTIEHIGPELRFVVAGCPLLNVSEHTGLAEVELAQYGFNVMCQSLIQAIDPHLLLHMPLGSGNCQVFTLVEPTHAVLERPPYPIVSPKESPPKKEETIDAFPPPVMASKAIDVGVRKSGLDTLSTFMLSILAGAFIAMGAVFATTVGCP